MYKSVWWSVAAARSSAQNLRVTLNTLKDRKARQEHRVYKGPFSIATRIM